MKAVYTTCSCGVVPSFGHIGGKAVACVKCKTAEMVHVHGRFCPCGKQANFGFEGNVPTACSGCATEGMRDILSKRCECCDVFASFPNKAGEKQRLCGQHAEAAGVIPAFNRRASRAACRAMDALAAEGVMFEHEHVNPVTMQWEGKEVHNLVAPRKHRPDGVRYDANGHVVAVFFYHGNRFHGYPPEHSLYDTEVTYDA